MEYHYSSGDGLPAPTDRDIKPTKGYRNTCKKKLLEISLKEGGVNPVCNENLPLFSQQMIF